MSGLFRELNGVRIFEVPSQGPELRTSTDALDVMSDASGRGTVFIVIPVERLADDFFNLRTRIAGEIAQKFATYGVRVAVVGNISQKVATSRSFAAFVTESNRGRHLWFVETLQELSNRLAKYPAGESVDLES
jgi:hypothetical protein